jgi:hypothetical protein
MPSSRDAATQGVLPIAAMRVTRETCRGTKKKPHDEGWNPQPQHAKNAHTQEKDRTQFGFPKLGFMSSRVRIKTVAEKFVSLPIVLHPADI